MFPPQELKIQPSLNSSLIPTHLSGESAEAPAAGSPDKQVGQQKLLFVFTFKLSKLAYRQDEAMAQPSGSS